MENMILKPHAIALVGRFQGVHAGHHAAAEEVKRLAAEHNANYVIFGTNTSGDAKNPLPPDVKARHMRTVLGTDNVFVDPSVNTPIEALQHLHNLGFGKITLVAGGKRADEYEKFRQYFGKRTVSKKTGRVLDLSQIHPANFVIHRIERDADSDAGETEISRRMIDPKTNKMLLPFVSGSRLRAATNERLDVFMSMLPHHVTADQASALQNDLRKHMRGIVREEVSAITRMKLAKAARRTASRRKIVRKSREKRRKNLKQLKVRAKNEIISQLRSRIVGKRRSWKSIPYSQRVMVDRNINKRKKLVTSMIKRIMPQVIKGESERLKNLNNSFNPILDNFYNNFLTEASKKTRTSKESNRQPVDSAQKARRKQQNRENQRNSRTNHKETVKSGNVRGKVYVVKNKSGEIEIVDKKSLRKDHEVIVDAKNASLGVVQKYLKNKSFSNTKTSIELFGYQKDAGGEEKPKKEKAKKSSESSSSSEKRSSSKKTVKQEQQAPTIPATKKASKKDTYATSHDATSMESGIAYAVNAAMGLTPEQMVSKGLIDKKDIDAVLANQHQSFMPSVQRAAQQIMKEFGGVYLKHTGRLKSTTKLSQEAIDNGVRDNTPKSDLLVVDADGNILAGLSQKIGDSQLSSGGPAETVTNLKFASTAVGDKLDPSSKKKIDKFIKFFETELAGNPRTRQGPTSLYQKGGEREGEDKEVARREELHQKATDMLNDVLNGDKKLAAAFIYSLVTGAGKFKEGDPAIATHIMSANRDGTDLKMTAVDMKYAEKLIGKVKFQMKFKSSAVETTDVKKKWEDFKAQKKKLGQKVTLAEDFRQYAYRSVIRAYAMTESINYLSGDRLIKVLLETKNSDLKKVVAPDPTTPEEAVNYLKEAFEYIGDDSFKLYQFFEDDFIFDTNQPVIEWGSLAEPQVSNYNTIHVNGKQYNIPVETPVNYNPNGNLEYPLIEAFLLEKKKRNYRQEYDRYHAKPEQRKNRSKRVLARRLMMKLGKVRKGDGKDVDHKDGNPKNNGKHNLRVRNKSENRADND